MTNKEAIKALNNLLVRTDITDEYGDMEDMTPYEKAVDMAIQALEKQIPKMVNYFANGYADGFPFYDEAECSNCGHGFEEDSENWGACFCENCGQALKWEEEE